MAADESYTGQARRVPGRQVMIEVAKRAYAHHLRLSPTEELLIDRLNQVPLGTLGSLDGTFSKPRPPRRY